eukprot:g8477.t1
MGRGEKDRYSSRDDRGDRGHGGRDRDRRDDEQDGGGSSRRGRDRSRSPGRKRGRHDRDSSRERSTKDRDGGGSSKRKEPRNKVSMGYDDDEEYGGDDGNGYDRRQRSASPPKVVDVEKIKPNTEENKGEISMSVEETNRVRAMLGLKPLNVGGGASGKPTEEEIAVENMRLKREEEEQARELKELEARLQKARTKRQLNEKLKGETLGEVKPGEEEVVSASDWVNRSRKKAMAMEEERLLAKQRERILEEQEMELANGGADGKKGVAAYGAENLAGLKVTHEAGAFEAGDSVILTLKDQGLLEEDEHGRVTGLKDDEDELENVHMKEAERRKELDKEAIRAKRGAYQAYDDEEFEGEIGPGAKRKVLSHYDEVQKEGPKLTLGQGGTAHDGAAAAGGAGEEKTKVLESLKVDVKDASEYYTTEEMAKFKKPKKMRKKKLRKREEAGTSSSLGLEAAIHDSTSKSRSSSAAAGAANGGTAAGSGGGGGGGGGDHGSRAARAARLAAAETADAGDKRKRFDSALAKAGERANEKLADSFAKPAAAAAAASAAAAPAAAPATDPMAFAAELDSDLGVSLARARRLAQMKDKAKARKSKDVGEAVREAVMRKKVKTEAAAAGARESEPNGDQMDVDGGGASEGVGTVPVKQEVNGDDDGGMVFTSTTEFTSRLEATLQERKRDSVKAAEKLKVKEELKQEEAKAKAKQGKHGRDGPGADRDNGGKEGGDAAEKAEAAKAKRSRWTTKGEDEEELDEEELMDMVEAAEDDSDEDEQMGFLHKQPLAKNGMAATLALLRPSGVLAEKFHRSGRAKDARRHHGEAEETRADRESGAKLEYRDQWGREITRKEAFRNLCYQFHGYGSGKKKQEKRLKMVEEEKKKERAMDLQRLRTLQQTQEITKQAYVVVQGGSHVGSALPPPPPNLELKKKAKAGKTKDATPAPG